MKSKQSGFIVVAIIVWVIILFVCGYGWVENLKVVIHTTTPVADWTSAMVIRAAGIVLVPLGVVMGYL